MYNIYARPPRFSFAGFFAKTLNNMNVDVKIKELYSALAACLLPPRPCLPVWACWVGRLQCCSAAVLQCCSAQPPTARRTNLPSWKALYNTQAELQDYHSVAVPFHLIFNNFFKESLQIYWQSQYNIPSTGLIITESGLARWNCSIVPSIRYNLQTFLQNSDAFAIYKSIFGSFQVFSESIIMYCFVLGSKYLINGIIKHKINNWMIFHHAITLLHTISDDKIAFIATQYI